MATTVSDTDVEMFMTMANPESHNTMTRPGATEEPITERFEDEEGSDDASDEMEDDDSDGEGEEHEEDDSGDELDDASNPGRAPSASSRRFAASRHGGISFSSRVQKHMGDDTHRSQAPTASHATHADPAPSAETVMSAEELLIEKQSTLLELERLRKNHQVKLTKEFTLEDRLDDMTFEVRRHLLNIEEKNTLNYMRDGLKICFTGIEFANAKLGPFLELDGWANEMSTDISKYDSALSRLHKKYWRRSTMSPEMELAMGLVGSIGMFHFKRKFIPRFSDLPNVMGQARPRTPPRSSADADDLDDEGLPAAFV